MTIHMQLICNQAMAYRLFAVWKWMIDNGRDNGRDSECRPE